jgi:hypothetical protein
MGAVDAQDAWAAINGCLGSPSTSDLPDVDPTDGTTVQLRTMSDCTVPVELYTILGGGHTWPDGLQYWPVSAIGATSRDLDASAVIEQFFTTYLPQVTATPTSTPSELPTATSTAGRCAATDLPDYRSTSNGHTSPDGHPDAT